MGTKVTQQFQYSTLTTAHYNYTFTKIPKYVCSLLDASIKQRFFTGRPKVDVRQNSKFSESTIL